MRKQFTLAIALLAFSAMGFAQVNENLVSKKGEQYLPEKGDWSIGFEANDLVRYIGNFIGNSYNSAPDLSLINNTFVGKYMDTDMSAYRLSVNLRINNETTTNITRSTGAKDITTKGSENAFGLILGLGKEWRKGSTRLQGYYGGEALVGLGTESETTRVHNPNNDGSVGFPINFERKSKEGLGFLVGARGFIGAEYFVLPKMAIGAEYSYGLSLYMEGESKVTETGKEPVKGGEKERKFYVGGNEDGAEYGVVSLKLSLYF